VVAVLNSIIVMVLVLLALQDWKDRAVNWYWFPILIISVLARLYFSDTYSSGLWEQLGLSFAFLLFNTAIVMAYIYFRFGKKGIQTGNIIGAGDLLFFLVIPFFGSFLHFLLFFTASLGVSLLLWLSVRNYAKHSTVPLAGLQALSLAAAWSYQGFVGYNTYNDEKILTLLFNTI
jgi:hypothetical protein